MLPPLKPESTLRDRYKILEAIGEGGMGSVYKAEDLRLSGRLCAIKEIQIDPNATDTQRQQAREQFHREASILARLDHPNLPKVSDFFNEGNRDYLVMDYVPGIDLRQRIEEVKSLDEFLPEDTVIGWANQLCDALDYLHRQQPPVLHRDIKPANIKLTPDGVIKLVDFGLVKLLEPEDDQTITVIQGRGTVVYTPLEQYGAEDEHTETRSDIYSFGATLYHLLTNELPAEAKARFLDPNTLTQPTAINPAISKRVEDAILWAMAMHPTDRPDTVRDLQAALISTGPLRALTAGSSRQLPEIAPVNRVLIVTTVGLLFLAVMVTLFAPVIP
jgi:serine/threonine-protein kinase